MARGIASDRDLLDLVASTADPSQPALNLLLGVVHFLLRYAADHPLRRYYRSFRDVTAVDDDPMPMFRDFCLSRAHEVSTLLGSKRVQTNEVGRAASLLPAFQVVSGRVGGHPLALIEIGASAGLLLASLWRHASTWCCCSASTAADAPFTASPRSGRKTPTRRSSCSPTRGR